MFLRPRLSSNAVPIPYGVGKVWGMPMQPLPYPQYAYPGLYPKKKKKKKKSQRQRQQQLQSAKSRKKSKKRHRQYFMPPIGSVSRSMNFLPPIHPPAFRFQPGRVVPLPPPIMPYGLSPRGRVITPMPPWIYDYDDDDSDDDYDDDDDYYDDDYIPPRRYIPRRFDKDFSPDWEPRDEWENFEPHNGLRKQPLSDRNLNQRDAGDNLYQNVKDTTQKTVKTNGKKK